MGVIEIIGYLISAYLSLQFERKKIIKYVLVFTSITHIIFFFFSEDYNKEWQIKALYFFISIVRIAVAGIYCFINVYIIEAFPTSVRHLVYALQGSFGKALWLLGPIYYDLCQGYGFSPLAPIGILILLGFPLT